MRQGTVAPIGERRKNSPVPFVSRRIRSIVKAVRNTRKRQPIKLNMKARAQPSHDCLQCSAVFPYRVHDLRVQPFPLTSLKSVCSSLSFFLFQAMVYLGHGIVVHLSSINLTVSCLCAPTPAAFQCARSGSDLQ